MVVSRGMPSSSTACGPHGIAALRSGVDNAGLGPEGPLGRLLAIAIREKTTGARLQVGEVVLEITGECEPCRVMDAQRQGLRAALAPDWRAGVSCCVVSPCSIRIGAPVRLQVTSARDLRL